MLWYIHDLSYKHYYSVTATGIECPTIRVSRNDHMTVRVSSRYVDGTATYTCYSGYEMDGLATSTCEATGAWSRSRPSCSRK